jgi:GNAT superfamily N-acetyltransferase
LFGWWSDPADVVAGAFMHTAPFPVMLTAVTAEAAAELATVTLAGRPLTAVNACPQVAEAFGDAWREGHGGRVQVDQRMRLYRLAELAWPDPAPDGIARAATAADTALLISWFTAFQREAHGTSPGGDQAADVRERLGYDGGITVWEAGGAPVSLACSTRQVARMARVGPVYTPPELRGRGYASGVTAVVSQQALRAGADEVLLYADLANPVSNSIYQRIGYRPVEDRLVLAFSGGYLPAGSIAFAGLGCILEGIMLLAGRIFRYVPLPTTSPPPRPPASRRVR